MKPIVYPLILIFLIACSNKKQFTDQPDILLAAPTDSSTLYFPTKLVVEGQEVDWRDNKWYSEILFALHEPVLDNYTGNKQIYRFTWLRSFDNPVSVRIQKDADNIVLILKVADRVPGSYKTRKIITDTSFSIEEKYWDKFIEKLEKADFSIMPFIDPKNPGDDGSEWILEMAHGAAYHFVTRWSAGNTPFGECCKYLLNLSGLKVPENHQY